MKRTVGAFALLAVFLTAICYNIFVISVERHQASPEQPLPEYRLSHVAVSGLTADENGTYRLEAPLLRHVDGTDQDELSEPVIIQEQYAGKKRVISADSGIFRRGANSIDLHGNVTIDNFGTEGERIASTIANSLTVILDEWGQ